MDPAADSRRHEPVITIFQCERCCATNPVPPGADGCCRVFSCCAGNVGGERIREAFLEGADGVMILGCLGSRCCQPLGEVEAFRHIHEGNRALHRLGVDPSRLQRHWVTAREAARAAQLVAAFRRRLTSLGPRFAPRPERISEPSMSAAQG